MQPFYRLGALCFAITSSKPYLFRILSKVQAIWVATRAMSGASATVLLVRAARLEGSELALPHADMVPHIAVWVWALG